MTATAPAVPGRAAANERSVRLMDGSQIAVLVAIFVVVLLAVNANRRRRS